MAGRRIDIDASDVPNNPVQQLVDSLDAATRGHAAIVWWNLEPDGYFLHFDPAEDRIRLRLDFAPQSQTAGSRTIAMTEGSAREILLPFWRFARHFQSGDHRQPHWPEVDYHALDDIAQRIKHLPADPACTGHKENH